MTREHDPDGGRTRALPDRGGIDVFDSLIVRQRVDDADVVREAVASWAVGGDDARTLLPVDGVTLVTLFLDDGRGDDREPALCWYVEVVDDDAPQWRDPAATVRDSPLFDGPLAGHVTGITVHRDGGDERLLVHATNPRRRALYADRPGRTMVVPAAGEELSIVVAVATARLRPGLPSRLAWLVGRAAVGVKSVGPVGRWARDQTEVIEEEGLYTESLLLERRTGGHRIHYYMETASTEQLYEALAASGHWTARVGEWAIRRLFVPADAERFLSPPLGTDAEVLIHAVHPDRP